MEIKGIDVSAWQGQIDWDKVASYGMDFVFIRITEVSVMGMERRGEQSISLSMSRIAEMTTSAVTNRVKGGQIKRDGKERTHGHK